MDQTQVIDFWLRPDHWPVDCNGYIFVLKAVDAIGKTLFDEWSSFTVATTFLAGSDATLVARGLPTEADKAVADSRFRAIQNIIRDFAASGGLRTKLRPPEEIKLSRALPKSLWNVDNVASRFEFGRMNRSAPLERCNTGNQSEIIYVEETGLDALLKSLGSASEKVPSVYHQGKPSVLNLVSPHDDREDKSSLIPPKQRMIRLKFEELWPDHNPQMYVYARNEEINQKMQQTRYGRASPPTINAALRAEPSLIND